MIFFGFNRLKEFRLDTELVNKLQELARSVFGAEIMIKSCNAKDRGLFYDKT